jgi:hemerythrin
MALLEWQPTFNLDIEIIDQQHQMLVKLINELYIAFSLGNDRQILGKLLNKLGVYAAMHFAREENFFEIYAYPETDEHLQEHDDFEDTIYQFEDEFNSGKQDLSISILNYLSDWLVKHINGSDREYAPFLKAKGAV